MAPSRPILGLLVGPEPPIPLLRLLVEMRPWCAPRAAEPGLAAAAWLVTSPVAPGIEAAARSGRPLAAWIEEPGELRWVEALAPALLLTSQASLAESAGATLISSAADAPADRIAVIPPFVRARLRRRSGLPALLVADLTSGAVPDALVQAALAVCSACVVTGARLSEAIAWGAPAVTDEPSAASVGARHDRDVLVGTAAERAHMAHELGRDPMLAARLSHRARRLAEAQSIKRAAALVAERLGLLRAAGTAIAPRVEAILRLLAVPASPLQPDVARALIALEQPGRAVAVTDRFSYRS